MKAGAVFAARREVQIIDHPDSDIQSPTQVKVRVLDVGGYGTDREITSFQYGTPPAASDSLIIGRRDLGIFMPNGPDSVRALIPARFPIDQATQPLSPGAGGMKNVVVVGS
jgi:threonine dehydrogenase-like Zn-dependent dehydrogenase